MGAPKIKINSKNIRSFIRGYSNYIVDQLGYYPDYLKEQVEYRLHLCKNDCIPQDGCKYCGCDPEKKVYDPKSCNNGDRFPDLMNEADWVKFKTENNISVND
jgi:hypothetical protein